MKKFRSLEQFRNVIKEVRLNHDYKGKDEEGKNIFLHDSPYPKLKFTGTVKMHGTNAGIVRYKEDGRTEFQSRERILSVGSDNFGFCTYFYSKNLDHLFNQFEFNDYMAIYGEWVGPGIQNGVALAQLPDRKFIVFAIKIDDSWVELSPNFKDEDINIYNVLQFNTYETYVDFNSPELSQNDLIEMTLEVEKECPVGKYFGISGIGEGIVFSCETDRSLAFKSKGEKHSVSKVKKLNSVNVEQIEDINKFVEYAVTENRLNQGLENVELDVKKTGDFIKWVANDILKEESDTLSENNLEWKTVAGRVANKSKEFFMAKINSNF